VTRRVRGALGLAVVIGCVAALAMHRGAAPTLATAEIVRGDYVDIVEIRGDVRPLKSIMVSAPMQAGELQILKLAASGSAVKAGDVVVEFDGSTLQRTIQEKQSELRQAQDELEQAKAQGSITTEQDRTTLLHSRYDVDRAKLGLTDDQNIISKIDAQKAKLAVADAEQRLRAAQTTDGANRDASTTGFAAQESKIAKVRADLERAQRSLAALKVTAPADGLVSILSNWRASSMGGEQEFRPGDRAWAGAQILELPDLSSVHLAARLDESDRGRLQVGQAATIRVDAIPDHDYQASVTDLSVLARVDFSSWPPVKQFDLKLTFRDADTRVRPGMSAAARVVVGRIPAMLLVPVEAVFLVDGRTLVYRAEGRAFVPVVVDVIKRGREQVAIKGPVRVGDRVSLTKPDVDAQKAAK
jgi:HlyD family secretion protein